MRPMPLTISSSFDAGNIRVVRQDGDSADLEIVQATTCATSINGSTSGVAGAAGREITLRITNCAGSAYPNGWPDYKGVMSLDREQWLRIHDTSYSNGVLTMKLTPPQDVVWIAYFAPYSMERHHDLVTQTAALPGVGYRSLGKSLDGQDIDCLTIGEGPLNVWLYARQHPGESMAEWWMEGALEKLTDEDDPVARILRKRMHLPRRPEHEPRRIAPRSSPHQRGRREPQPRMACAVGREEPRSAVRPQRDGRDRRPTSRWTCMATRRFPRTSSPASRAFPRLPSASSELFELFSETLERLSPDFQRQKGYEIPAPGQANMSMSTTQLAERYGCVSMTLEMPFKDNFDLPDEVYGWSPQRSKYLAFACLDALHAILPELKQGQVRARRIRRARKSPPDAHARTAAARPVAVESRKPLHRLVGRRSFADWRRRSARRGPLLRDKGFDFDCCFTSVLTRAIRTLHLVLHEMDRLWLPVTKDWHLNERHYGGLTGLNKQEMIDKVGAEQVKIWRRSYDIPPPPLEPGSHYDVSGDRRYAGIEVPQTESLKDTIARAVPYYEREIAPALGCGQARARRRAWQFAARDYQISVEHR